MKLVLLLLVAATLASGCSLTGCSMTATDPSDPPPAPPSGPPAPSGPSFLALGDSYTIGEGVSQPGTWPFQTARALRESGTPVANPLVIARTGWTVAELDAAVDARQAQLRPPYRLVTLLIGVNDQYRGGTADAYRAPFRALLARAVGFAGGEAGRVVVVSIPDYGVTPFASGRDGAEIAREVDAFNAVARDEAARAGARFVDVTPLSRQQGALVVADGLHPNAEAYAGWTALVVPAARAALAE